jgi:multiple antibiotic resistance protein
VDHFSSTFLTDLIRSIIALFVVIDPIGSVPVFIALTQKMERAERASVTKTAIITAAGLLFVFAVAGAQILSIFGITISSFMVAGGILLFIGAITAVMISFQTAGLIVTALSILIVIGITYIVLRYIDRIHKVIGRRGSIIVTRVFAVLIAAIAVQFIVDGARALFS